MSKHEFSTVLKNYCPLELVGIDEVLTESDTLRLWQHLHNGNGPFEWVLCRRETTGHARFLHSKQLAASDGIKKAAQTIYKWGTFRNPIGFATFPAHHSGKSCWGALDFDAHDKNERRALRFALAAWSFLTGQYTQCCAVLDRSHYGGFHLFVITASQHPCSDWYRFLHRVTVKIGASLEPGVCEIFPHAEAPQGLGKALRVPGTYHPRSDTCTRLIEANLLSLVADLPVFIDQPTLTQAYDAPAQQELIAENSRRCVVSVAANIHIVRYHRHEGDWVRRFHIREPSTRNSQLKTFVENAFFQLGYSTARNIAQLQFAQKKVKTDALLNDHLKDFDDLWESCNRTLLLPKLTPAEKAMRETLKLEPDRSAFRIINSFHRHALKNANGEFAIVRDNFAMRLSITPVDATDLIRQFRKLNIIRRTRNYVPRTVPARYRWVINERSS